METLKSKRRLRQQSLATRYDCTVRSVQRMIDDGRIPPPDFYLGRVPYWNEETLEANERSAAIAPNKKEKAA